MNPLKKTNYTNILIHLLLITACVITIFPILRIVTVSIRPGSRLLSTSLKIIPEDASLGNYKQALMEHDFLLWVWNSFIVTMTTAVIGLIISSTSAYALSRWKFKGRNTMLVFLLATQMIPAAMLMVPLYLLAAKLGLINTYRGIIVAYSVQAIPFSIWVLKGYYDSIPRSLEEAAMIDGAPPMYTFWKIILPLAAPAMAIAFLFNFMNSWNEFMLARIMLPKGEMFTWPLGLQSLQGQFNTNWGVYAASSVMISIPVVALFLYSSKWLVSGLTMGSVKG